MSPYYRKGMRCPSSAAAYGTSSSLVFGGSGSGRGVNRTPLPSPALNSEPENGLTAVIPVRDATAVSDDFPSASARASRRGPRRPLRRPGSRMAAGLRVAGRSAAAGHRVGRRPLEEARRGGTMPLPLSACSIDAYETDHIRSDVREADHTRLATVRAVGAEWRSGIPRCSPRLSPRRRSAPEIWCRLLRMATWKGRALRSSAFRPRAGRVRTPWKPGMAPGSASPEGAFGLRSGRRWDARSRGSVDGPTPPGHHRYLPSNAGKTGVSPTRGGNGEEDSGDGGGRGDGARADGRAGGGRVGGADLPGVLRLAGQGQPVEQVAERRMGAAVQQDEEDAAAEGDEAPRQDGVHVHVRVVQAEGPQERLRPHRARQEHREAPVLGPEGVRVEQHGRHGLPAVPEREEGRLLLVDGQGVVEVLLTGRLPARRPGRGGGPDMPKRDVPKRV